MKIGFIGLGNVGGKLAGSLSRNKFDLTVRDLDKKLIILGAPEIIFKSLLFFVSSILKGLIFNLFFESSVKSFLNLFKYKTNSSLKFDLVL